MTLKKQKDTSFIQSQALCIISKPLVNSNSPETLNSGQNWQFFVLSDLEIWRMTLKNNKAPPLYYIKLCASFQSHQWIQTGVTVPKHYLGQNQWFFFVSCDLEIWWMTLKNNRAPLLCYFKLFASFDSHQWIQTRVTVWKCPIRIKIDDFCTVWPWNLTNDFEKQ